MWIFLSDAALSIVADRNDKTKLLVRARLPHDINAIFPKAKLFTKPTYDYRYRALISRAEVAKVVADKLLNIDYTNFKDSVSAKEGARHDAYMDIWSIMHALQR